MGIMAGAEEALGELALQRGLITAEQLDAARAEQRGRPRPLSEILSERNLLAPERLRELEAELKGGLLPTLRFEAPADLPETDAPEEVRIAKANPRNDLGEFVLQRMLGRGGMGEVYRAWEKPLRRFVALKFIQQATEEDRQRLVREAQVSAKLDHPDIVPVYKVGASERGPFIAMKYIEGETLDRADLTLRQKLMAVRDAAWAIEFAHGQGVVHRDIKPQNIMVESGGGGPGSPSSKKPGTQRKGKGKDDPAKIYVMDFGLAKQRAVDTSISGSGIVVGTPAFMPPEQAQGRSSEVDARSDVYSLGATLYRLVTAAPPFQGDDPYSLLKKVIEEDPHPPRRLNAALPREVETIILKSMEKEKGRRYSSAQALGDDLERFLQGEPISARPASVLYRARKFAVRRPALVALAAVVFGGIVSAIAGIVTYVKDIRSEQARTEAARDQAVREQGRAERNAEQAVEEAERARRAKADADSARVQAQQRLARSLAAEADALAAGGRTLSASEKYSEARREAGASGLSEFPSLSGQWRLILRAPPTLLEIRAHEKGTLAAVFSPDGRTIASGGRDGTVRLWDAVSGRPVLAMTHGAPVASLVFAPDGSRVYSGAEDGTLREWRMPTGEEGARFELQAPVRGLAVSPSGNELAACGDRLARVWDLQTQNSPGRAVNAKSSHLTTCAFAQGGALLLTGGRSLFLEALDPRTGAIRYGVAAEQEGFSQLSLTWGMAVSPDGRRAAVAGLGIDMTNGRTPGFLWLIDLATGAKLQSRRDHSRGWRGVAYSPDGFRLAAASFDGTAALFDSRDGSEIAMLIGHSGGVNAVAFSPDARWVVTAGEDGTLRLWPADGVPAMRDLPGHWDVGGLFGLLSALAVSPDGRLLATGAWDGRAKLWEAATGRELWASEPATGHVEALIFDEHATVLAAGRDNGEIRLYEVGSGRLSKTLRGHRGAVEALARLPGGKCASTGKDGTVRIWDLKEGAPQATFEAHPKGGISLSASSDGRSAASLGTDGVLRVWDLAAGKETTTISDLESGRAVAISPDGTRAVVGGGRKLRLVDLRAGTVLLSWDGHDSSIHSVGYSPDGIYFVSASDEIKIWEAETGREIRHLEGHDGPAKAMFLPDGAVGSVGFDGRLRIWNLPLPDRFRDASPAWARYFHAGAWDRALETLDGTESRLDRARCLWMSGRLAEARQEFAKAREAGEAPGTYVEAVLGGLERRVSKIPSSRSDPRDLEAMLVGRGGVPWKRDVREGTRRLATRDRAGALALLERGLRALESDPRESARSLATDAGIREVNVAYYNLACCCALAQRPVEALNSLKRAVESGFSDAAHMSRDPDLASIRQGPEWEELIRRVTQPPKLGITGREAEDGVAVVEVSAGSPAAAAGLRSGDILVRVGAMEVAIPTAVAIALRRCPPEAPCPLRIRRGGVEFVVQARLSK